MTDGLRCHVLDLELAPVKGTGPEQIPGALVLERIREDAGDVIGRPAERQAQPGSGAWATAANGRRKVPFLSGLMLATSGCVACMAFTPRTAFGAWMLVGLVILGWIFWSAVVTIRTSVWRANYPDANRTRITGRLATVQVLVMATGGFVIGWSLDQSVESIRFLFPILGAFGVVGAILYGGVRLRGQSRLARAERQGHRSERPAVNPLSVLKVLAEEVRRGGPGPLHGDPQRPASGP